MDPAVLRLAGMAHPDLAAAGLVVGIERAQQGRLAAARGPVERQALAGRHLQAEPVEHRQAHAALHVQHEGLREVLHADRRAFHHIAHVTSYLPSQTWSTEETRSWV